MNTAQPSRGSLLRLVRSRVVVPVALLLAATAVASEAPDALIRRYPFDPACPWGRVNNGKGMIVRCLAEDEANKLLEPTALTRPASTLTPVAPLAPAAPAPSSAATASAAPPAPVPSASVAAGTNDPSPSASGPVEVAVGPIVADQGELSVTKLKQASPRYARCVADHGGLRDRAGEVHVRFLVRSEGIAEGVSVLKRVNIGAEAARCVAEVVDRRRVGVPDAPLVGATVVIKFDKTAQ